MTHLALIPWLDPETIINSVGPWALLVICLILFAETALLLGFVLPGDSLLLVTGVFIFGGVIHADVWFVAICLALSALIGGEVGYLIGRVTGPRIFESGRGRLLGPDAITRTNAFFAQWGAFAIVIARFVPVARTVAPVAAGIAKMQRRTYLVYNALGAVLWTFSMTFAGYALGWVPPIKDFVLRYTDLIIIGAVAIAVVPTIFHLLQARRRARAAAIAQGPDQIEA